MTDELNAYLDGELSYDELPQELRESVEAWKGLEGELGRIGSTGAPPWLEDRVMREIAATAPVGGWLGWLALLLKPRTFAVSPLAGSLGAVAALLVMFFLGRGFGAGGIEPAASTASAPDPGAVYVQFVLDAPGAQSVAVAGDFNNWEDGQLLEDVDGDGVWTGQIHLTPGVHEYMFVLDGTNWVTDPRAMRYADDGFGNRNAIMTVTPPRA